MRENPLPVFPGDRFPLIFGDSLGFGQQIKSQVAARVWEGAGMRV